MISMRYRDVLPSYVADEFDSLIAQLKAWALEEHDEEGHHIVTDRDLAFVPVGARMGWFTGTPPRGWLIAEGQQLDRVTYKALFDLWGTTFGVGDGSTTFNIPDLRGRFFLSKAASGTGSTLGETFGALDHTHTAGSHTHSAGTLAGPSHTHTGPSHTHTGPSHTHTGPSHTHGNGSLQGITPSLTTFVDNDGGGSTIEVVSAAATYDITGSTGSEGTGATGAGGTGATGAGGTGATGADGTGAVTGSTGSASGGATDAANPPSFVGNTIVFTGVAA